MAFDSFHSSSSNNNDNNGNDNNNNTRDISATSSKVTKIRALQFNVWLDATRVRGGLELTAQKIIESQADIVSLCEVKNLMGDFVERLKKELKARGAIFYGKFAGNPRKFGLDADTAIISRFPITEEVIVYRTRENSIVRSIIELDGGHRCSLAVYSVHLEYRAYTTYLPRGYSSNSASFPGWQMIRPGSSYGWTMFGAFFLGWLWDKIFGGKPEPITDVDAIARLIDDTRSLQEKNVPIVIMGDFNEPSTLDWTADTAHHSDHNGLVYSWDSTELLKENDFVDSYRELYPNPLTHPGFTWPVVAQGTNDKPLNTGWIKMADERDRIDYIFYKGYGLKALDSWLVGTPLSVVRDAVVDESELYLDKWSDQARCRWPSDHRAVMTVLETRHG